MKCFVSFALFLSCYLWPFPSFPFLFCLFVCIFWPFPSPPQLSIGIILRSPCGCRCKCEGKRGAQGVPQAD
ncbi:hypothetical protein LX32DRAFT_220041 [Colletotrichum zoysiae]|uniref:Uncharacterized protein n=1 Tax=Colletotrichum zoysiae TaxID=1216348 RepID=A0AAD9HND9_9PEZI|nr:hypothetical protein LX32DRAFT_220041 [Colletotrichum zoysiae]